MSPTAYFGHVGLTRLLLQRGVACIYFVAFLSLLLQGKPLLGTSGLLPIPEFLKRSNLRGSPSLFHWRYSDALLRAVSWTGLLLSVCGCLGVIDAGPIWLSVSAWLLLYFLYLSVVNVGQAFFSFGWESMLLEAGFFTAFLGPRMVAPPVIPILILRWMFIRTELGAGLIKLRHDPCWRDLTCLYYHYETQPLPNPLSWYFHRLPKALHRFGVLFSHFLQVICPLALFAPQPFASIAAALCVMQQLWLIISGNYSWLNWLTVVLGITGFSDETFGYLIPHLAIAYPSSVPLVHNVVIWAVGVLALFLSYRPLLNLFSRDQLMNYSYNRFHLVNTYGAFGSVTRERHEIVIEGTEDGSSWKEYGFKGKPGDVKRLPPQVAPYHLRLDWMIWFLPFTVSVTAKGIRVRGYERWFLRFVRKLLAGDGDILALMAENPFPEQPPAAIRARFYRYNFTTAQVRARTGAWWQRELLGEYLPAVDLESFPDL